jgi:hypothetical protein
MFNRLIEYSGLRKRALSSPIHQSDDSRFGTVAQAHSSISACEAPHCNPREALYVPRTKSNRVVAFSNKYFIVRMLERCSVNVSAAHRAEGYSLLSLALRLHSDLHAVSSLQIKTDTGGRIPTTAHQTILALLVFQLLLQCASLLGCGGGSPAERSRRLGCTPRRAICLRHRLSK